MFTALDVFSFGDTFKKNLLKHYIHMQIVQTNFHLALPKDLTFIVGSVKAVRFGHMRSFYTCNIYRNSGIMCLSIPGRTVSISQRADYTTLFKRVNLKLMMQSKL